MTAVDTAIQITRELAAPRERVHHRWTDAAALARWFAPAGFATVHAEAAPRPGGPWSLTFESDDGVRYTEHGHYREIIADLIVLTLTQSGDGWENPETLVTVRLEDIGTPEAPRTRMSFRQDGYRSEELRKANEEGWGGCFEALGRDVGDVDGGPSDETALRALFAQWFDASERKDLDASMAPIAADVVSYEHEAPQQFLGAEAVRQVCAKGFDYQPEGFRWDVPDLHVEVSGDLAVTWGLNRMQALMPDGTVRTDWSRGTRIFHRDDGEWRMVHQHVSFPVDADGRASTAP